MKGQVAFGYEPNPDETKFRPIIQITMRQGDQRRMITLKADYYTEDTESARNLACSLFEILTQLDTSSAQFDPSGQLKLDPLYDEDEIN